MTYVWFLNTVIAAWALIAIILRFMSAPDHGLTRFDFVLLALLILWAS